MQCEYMKLHLAFVNIGNLYDKKEIGNNGNQIGARSGG